MGYMCNKSRNRIYGKTRFIFRKSFFNKSKKVILFSSSEIGEGEHKIFSYIRNNKNKHIYKTTIIYGLDADLIMLSLKHLSFVIIYIYIEIIMI